LLVDTYDTLAGVAAAITVSREAAAAGGSVAAIRLDSGDLGELARASRALLDEAGLKDIKIVASGGLDEYSVDRLVRDGAPIDVFGVGTKVGTSADAPYTDLVYKIVQYDGRPVMKMSTDKGNLPGPKQVYRRVQGGTPAGDLICTDAEPSPTGPGWAPLMETVMAAGARTGESPSLSVLRDRFASEMARLPDGVKELSEPTSYPVTVSERLKALARTTQP
jgi:nicotinate phosphoribosyltransferase